MQGADPLASGSRSAGGSHAIRNPCYTSDSAGFFSSCRTRFLAAIFLCGIQGQNQAQPWNQRDGRARFARENFLVVIDIEFKTNVKTDVKTNVKTQNLQGFYKSSFSRKASLTINQSPRLGLVLTLNSA
ncbi:hypothetical protein [Actimicrobium antarcticum]|uniref:hypothetical protein n=1 Tax=Actimicrobium antarcticum TaxID=1051899 RepID=UPI0031CEB9ED